MHPHPSSGFSIRQSPNRQKLASIDNPAQIRDSESTAVEENGNKEDPALTCMLKH
jgi:hypothetical protein